MRGLLTPQRILIGFLCLIALVVCCWLAWWQWQRGAEGAVRSVTRRARTRITGILRRQGKLWVLEPDDPGRPRPR